MAIRVKLTCPLCKMNKYISNGLELELSEDVDLPELLIVNTVSTGRGKIKHYQSSFEEFPGRGKENLKQMERKILKNIHARAERLCSLVELRLQEL